MTAPSQAYRPETAILDLGEAFYDQVAPADFPKAILRFRNDRAAAEVGIFPSPARPEPVEGRTEGEAIVLTDAEWIAHFGRFQPLPGSLPRPLALRYHGHQFRVYNPEIGDGRGFLFAQL
ncbi:MAG TPA: protein adenylyltransferase SelO family protein, partial [Sphingomonas sp.]